MGSRRKPDAGKVSMYAQRTALEQLVQEQFAVLVDDKGFTASAPERSPITSTFYFTRSSLGFQITLDFRDETVYVYLLRIADGRIPQHGYIVDGEVVRLPLGFVLRSLLRLVDEPMEALYGFLRASSLDYEGAVEAVKRWREIIERNVDLIEQTPSNMLFPPAEMISRLSNIGY